MGRCNQEDAAPAARGRLVMEKYGYGQQDAELAGEI